MDSGVPQGTVLGPTLFLCQINDLPQAVQSQVHLFADDCLIYQPIKSHTDHITLQSDLLELEKWADKWGMRFNAKKCYILSINNRSSHFYSLGNHILKQVDENPYLGLTITENLKWSSHITKITKEANTSWIFKTEFENVSYRLTENSIYLTHSISVGLRLHNLGSISHLRHRETRKSSETS